MTFYSAENIYQLARGAGLGHKAAITATAIAFAESSGNSEAVGDVNLEDATWGPSIGLWQIRSVKGERGTGKSRDATRLKNPEFNAASMASISNGGMDFGAWSTYKSGAYKASLGTAQSGAAAAGTSPSVGVSPVGFDIPSIPPVHLPNPFDLGGDLLGLGGDLLDGTGAAAGAAGAGIASAVVGLLIKEAAPVVLVGAGLLGGFALIGIGFWRGTATS